MYNRTKVIQSLITPNEVEFLAKHYRNAPVDTPLVSEYIRQQFRSFVAYVASAEADKGITVWHVTGQPYNNASDMRLDYHGKHHLDISKDHNDSPLLGSYHNLLFRFAHDCHHCQTDDCQFNLDGEICAFVKFARFAKPYCKRQGLADEIVEFFIMLLFSEIVVQVCYVRYYGEYSEQKIVFNSNEYMKIANRVITAYKGN